MYCTQCGKEVCGSDRFCAYCGNNLDTSRAPTEDSEPPTASALEAEPNVSYQPLATSTEYFRGIWDKLPVVLDIPDISPQSLALVDIVFTSERIVFLPCDRSRWDSGHLMLLGAVGGPIGLLVAGGAGALWDKLTQSKSEKAFDGAELDKLVRAGLAISAANSELEVNLQQVTRGIAQPGTWATYDGTFVYGPESHKGRIDSIHVAKAKEIGKQHAKVSSVHTRLLPQMASGNWDQLTRAGKYLASIACKSELVIMRRKARKIPFPQLSRKPSTKSADRSIADLVKKHEISNTVAGSFRYKGMRFNTLEEAIEYAEQDT